jgi:hypothetical protein
MTRHEAQRELWPSKTRGKHQSAHIYSSLAPAIPTVVFDTYWRFAAERQEIFFRRLQGANAPWTDDPILREYKFTNAYRASDRVSQYLIRNVIYAGDQALEEVFFRTILFKLFNKIETWELLRDTFGEVRHDEYTFKKYDAVLTRTIDSKKTIYSAAYIMPSGGRASGVTRKHRSHLLLLESMMKDEVPARIADARTMREAFELLLSYPMIGDFLAYQYVTDINYSNITNFSESEFVVAGPGALDGISKCFTSTGGLRASDLIKLVAERQEAEFDARGISFKALWGRPLKLIDCQNLFCEISKYARVRHPEVTGVAGRTRIKQRYKSTSSPLTVWYPPKWNINEKLEFATT